MAPWAIPGLGDEYGAAGDLAALEPLEDAGRVLERVRLGVHGDPALPGQRDDLAEVGLGPGVGLDDRHTPRQAYRRGRGGTRDGGGGETRNPAQAGGAAR